MRWFWVAVAALGALGAVAWWMDTPDGGAPMVDAPAESARASAGAHGTAPTPAPAPVAAPIPNASVEPNSARTTAVAPAANGSTPRGDSLALGMDATISAATVSPGNITRLPSGALSCDGRYELTGDGTRERPYQVTWEFLTSAEDTYVPRLGMSAVPQRLAILQNSWVTVSGYIAYPLVATETDEVLLMLNQWDGCCIGVPPTPYDAVEVRLEHAIEVGRRHQIQYATITGKLEIDPYVVDKWLVGLYLMEDASLTTDL